MQKHGVGNQYFLGIEEKNVVFSQFPEEAWKNREFFEECCDNFHVYGKKRRQEYWDNYHSTKEILLKPVEKEKPKKIKMDTDFTMKSEYGWLSRDGTYFPCNYALHDKYAKQICINQDWDLTNPTQTLEDKGWVRIHRVEFEPDLYFSHTKPLSKDQQKKIDRYCTIHDVPYQNTKL